MRRSVWFILGQAGITALFLWCWDAPMWAIALAWMLTWDIYRAPERSDR